MSRTRACLKNAFCFNMFSAYYNNNSGQSFKKQLHRKPKPSGDSPNHSNNKQQFSFHSQSTAPEENAERKAKENREKEEKIKEKRAAKKAEEEKAAKKRAEKSAEGKETGDYTLSVTGNDVKSMTQSLVAGSVSISAPDRSSFDIKA